MSIEEDFEYTILEISKELNISKEKCRQVLLIAMKKLRNQKFENKFMDVKDILNQLQDKNSTC